MFRLDGITKLFITERNMKKLVDFLNGNPLVREVYFNEAGEWMFHSRPGFEKVLSREEILDAYDESEDELGEEGKVIEPKTESFDFSELKAELKAEIIEELKAEIKKEVFSELAEEAEKRAKEESEAKAAQESQEKADKEALEAKLKAEEAEKSKQNKTNK